MPEDPAAAFSHHLLRFAAQATLDPALPEAERVAACNDALEHLLELGDPEPLPAILAARVTAAHLIAQECLRRSMRDGPGEDSRLLLLGKAALMPAVMDSFVRVLEIPRGLLPDARRLLLADPFADSDEPDPDHEDFFPEQHPMSGEKPAADPIFSPVRHPMSGDKPALTLRNGNPRRDLATLPCCGAKARSGLGCRQPAMRNGRCRFHGGKSTGPRTPAGLDAARAAATRHGFHAEQGRRFLALARRLQASARLLNRARALIRADLGMLEQAIRDEPGQALPKAQPAAVMRRLRTGRWRPSRRPARDTRSAPPPTPAPSPAGLRSGRGPPPSP